METRGTVVARAYGNRCGQTPVAFFVDYLARVRTQESDSDSAEKEPLQAPCGRNADEDTEPERNEYREEPPTQ